MSNNLVLTIGSMNCRGLTDNKKRADVFDWIKRKKYDITILLDTHSTSDSEKQLYNELSLIHI